MSTAEIATRAADCTPPTPSSTEPVEGANTGVEKSTPKKPLVETLPYMNRRFTRFKGLRLDQHLCPNGTIRRYVVLDELRHRQLLGQPRRREIDPLSFRNTASEGFAETLWKTSEMWELADREGIRLLRELSKRVDELKTSEEPERRRRTSKGLTLPSTLQPVAVEGEVRGLLLHAGVRENGVFCIDLYDETEGCVCRIEGTDLARALEVSDAKPHEVIYVRPTGTQAVNIVEERSGTHGTGSHAITHTQQTFEIVREVRSPLHYAQTRKQS